MPTKPSPFPGMDPYLERRWGNTHTHLVSTAAEELNLRLPDDLSAEIEEYVHIDVDDGARLARKPDVYVIDDPLSREQRFGPAEGTAVVDVPIVMADPGPYTERTIHIMDDAGNRIVTAIEFLSPGNKRSGAGREEYLRKRAAVLASHTHLIEVDLVRAGNWNDMTEPFSVPPEYRTTYRVSVYRETPTGKLASWYPVRLSDRLPTIAVPLRVDDEEIRLDLQSVLNGAFQKGAGRRVDYNGTWQPSLSPAEAEWADRLLRAAGERI